MIEGCILILNRVWMNKEQKIILIKKKKQEKAFFLITDKEEGELFDLAHAKFWLLCFQNNQ